MAERVDDRFLPGLLGTAGKAIAAMPEGRRVIEQLRKADTRDDVLFLLRSADLGLAEPARDVVTRAVTDPEQWRAVRAALVRSAELQLHERYSSNA